jgi:di/tricarboxylate transporter
MSIDAWITLATLSVIVAGLIASLPPDVVLMGGVTLLLALGVIDPTEAFAGFSNTGVVTIGVLFVVAAGLRQTGAMDDLLRRALGSPKSLAAAQLRMMGPVALLSTFVNNTPVVAIVLPIVIDWAKRTGLKASKLLIPLSYSAVLGGTCTLIGTSTNLVVSGMAATHEPPIPFGLFDITVLGVPALLVGVLYVVAASRWLLPNRQVNAVDPSNMREYVVTMRVEADAPIVGKTIEQAGLRQLPGLFLVELQRGDRIIPAVRPDTVLEADDHLLFAGNLDSVIDLRRVRGLVPALTTDANAAQRDRVLVEVVVAARSAFAGLSIRETRFRTRYEAAIIAAHRGGEHLAGKIGDIVLRPGDVLLIEARRMFAKVHGTDRNFALVREVAGSAPPEHKRAWIAALAALGMVVAAALGLVPLITAALVATGVLVLTRCLTSAEAIASIELRILIAIAAAFGVGRAIETTGLAALVGGSIVEAAMPFGPVALVAALYGATAILTEVVTNNAAAALMFPFAIAVAHASGLDPKPLLLVIMMAASASFSTPLGYQTNLMVFGPGRYRFVDFLRFGIPLQLAVGVTTVTMASILWY